jgi:hypothetical protein
MDISSIWQNDPIACHPSQKHNLAVVTEDDASDLNIGSQCWGKGQRDNKKGG